MLEDVLAYAQKKPEVVAAYSAAVASIIAFVSIFLSIVGLYIQRIHNRKSVTPIAAIQYWDRKKKIEVRVRNCGVGPLRIDDLAVVSIEDQSRTHTIHDQMINSGLNHTYTHFAGDIRDQMIPVNGWFTLLQLEGDPDDPEFKQKSDDVRRVLSKLVVHVSFSDIYGKPVATSKRSLKWFGRHFDGDVENFADPRPELPEEVEYRKD